MLGAIIGDIVGSRFEFNNHLSKEFEFLHPSCEFTDDTVMTCAVAQALLDCRGDYTCLSEIAVDALHRIGRPYPDCGYGGRFIAWMYGDDPQPYFSCGNGAAMRISAVGDVARSVEEAKELSLAVTAITHNHPEGIKAAEAVAVAIVMAKNGSTKEEIRRAMEEYYALEEDVSSLQKTYKKAVGDTRLREMSQYSVPQALQCFLDGEDFEDVIRNCISIGGDCDTTGAIAGAVAEAYYGIPGEYRERALRYLDERLRGIVEEFYETLKPYQGKN